MPQQTIKYSLLQFLNVGININVPLSFKPYDSNITCMCQELTKLIIKKTQ